MISASKKIKNSKKIVLMFPGQGSQYTGMGKELIRESAKVKALFEEASEKLSFSFLKIISGSEADGRDLSGTFFSQLCIFILSTAVKEYIFEDGEEIKKNILCNIGHSLGDYSALTASEYFSFEAGLDVVAKRAKLMEDANNQAEGMMAAVLGLTKKEIESKISESQENIYIANINDSRQIVISGLKKDVKKFIIFLKNSVYTKVIPLKVKIASHCPIMQPVSDKLYAFLTKLSPDSLKTVFFSSSEKRFCSNKEIVQMLSEQLVKTVNWYESIQCLLNSGAGVFIEVGPGRVLSNLVKKIAQKNNKDINIFDTDSMENINVLKNFLSERFK